MYIIHYPFSHNKKIAKSPALSRHSNIELQIALVVYFVTCSNTIYFSGQCHAELSQEQETMQKPK